jgi:hypothetical protein
VKSRAKKLQFLMTNLKPIKKKRSNFVNKGSEAVLITAKACISAIRGDNIRYTNTTYGDSTLIKTNGFGGI